MAAVPEADEAESLVPPLRELGEDLLRTTVLQRGATLALPFLCTAAYFVAAARGWWPAAVLAVMGLSFFTYGSTSHDLVHRTLGLRRWPNDLLLSATELLCLRSGHAYQMAHLFHHAQFPDEDDVEGASARMSFLRGRSSRGRSTSSGSGRGRCGGPRPGSARSS